MKDEANAYIVCFICDGTALLSPFYHELDKYTDGLVEHLANPEPYLVRWWANLENFNQKWNWTVISLFMQDVFLSNVESVEVIVSTSCLQNCKLQYHYSINYSINSKLPISINFRYWFYPDSVLKLISCRQFNCIEYVLRVVDYFKNDLSPLLYIALSRNNIDILASSPNSQIMRDTHLFISSCSLKVINIYQLILKYPFLIVIYRVKLILILYLLLLLSFYYKPELVFPGTDVQHWGCVCSVFWSRGHSDDRLW